MISFRQKFTQYERDSETDLDFAQARMYTNRLGRFTSPDSFTNDTHVSDPQSWNLYVYVRNNPLKYIDPHGKDLFVTINGVGYRVLFCDGAYILINRNNSEMAKFKEGSFEKSVESLFKSSGAVLTPLMDTDITNTISFDKVDEGDESSSDPSFGTNIGTNSQPYFGEYKYEKNSDDFGTHRVDDNAEGEGIIPVLKTAIVATNTNIAVSGDNKTSQDVFRNAVNTASDLIGREVFDNEVQDKRLFKPQQGKGLGTDSNCPTKPDPNPIPTPPPPPNKQNN